MKQKKRGEKKTNAAANNKYIRSKIDDFKQEQILEVANKLFYEQGYRSTSLDAVAKELGVSKPFIYYQFSSKQKILHGLVRRTADRTSTIFDGLDLDNGNPSELMKELTYRYAKVVIDTRMQTAVFWREKRKLSQIDNDLIQKDKQKFDRRFTKILERGLKSGEFELTDPKLTNLFLQGMIIWIYTWYRSDHRLKADDIASAASNLAMKMISSKK